MDPSLLDEGTPTVPALSVLAAAALGCADLATACPARSLDCSGRAVWDDLPDDVRHSLFGEGSELGRVLKGGYAAFGETYYDYTNKLNVPFIQYIVGGEFKRAEDFHALRLELSRGADRDADRGFEARLRKCYGCWHPARGQMEIRKEVFAHAVTELDIPKRKQADLWLELGGGKPRNRTDRRERTYVDVLRVLECTRAHLPRDYGGPASSARLMYAWLRAAEENCAYEHVSDDWYARTYHEEELEKCSRCRGFRKNGETLLIHVLRHMQ